jgi:hypothetical protein
MKMNQKDQKAKTNRNQPRAPRQEPRLTMTEQIEICYRQYEEQNFRESLPFPGVEFIQFRGRLAAYQGIKVPADMCFFKKNTAVINNKWANAFAQDIYPYRVGQQCYQVDIRGPNASVVFLLEDNYIRE